MGWMIIIVLAYLPIFYRIHKRLGFLESEVERLKNEKEL
ncbi:uncharacterized small protein (DUF1192 family) [Planomicrobium sp. HSC-17F08]|nr:hypothetical protein G159_14090 [Planococcus glaciei CHR43]MCP2034723.1 uncharacterized small protein (DUF1192 family) [Planomicrobium sp. HSC-17F08]